MTHEEILMLLRAHAGAIGVHKVAERSGIPRTHVYTMLGPDGNSTLESLLKLCAVFGLALEIHEEKKP